jgi:uncharacterized protein (TIGR02246 family)
MNVADLQILIDRTQVTDVIVRTALAQDARDWQAVADCFADDAVYLHPGGRMDGVEAIVERSRRALQPLDASQHLVSSIHVSVEGDTASSTAYFQAQHVRKAAAGGELYTIAGTYRDTFSRQRGQWRIVERRQEYSWRDGNPAVIVRGPVAE